MATTNVNISAEASVDGAIPSMARAPTYRGSTFGYELVVGFRLIAGIIAWWFRMVYFLVV
jgi:hypothetical protein